MRDLLSQASGRTLCMLPKQGVKPLPLGIGIYAHGLTGAIFALPMKSKHRIVV